MRCKQVYRFICENIDRDMNSPRCRQIKKHLDGCPECSAYLASLRGTVRLYRKRPLPGVPASVHKDLVKALDVAWMEEAGKVRGRKSRARGGDYARRG